MNEIKTRKKQGAIIGLIIVIVCIALMLPSESIKAEPSFSDSLAEALLADPSYLLSSSYSDTDSSGNRQASILSSLGIMNATNGDSFVLLSTGIAGSYPMTSNAENPGSERGEWFQGGQYPRNQWPYIYDRSTLTMDVLVPENMNYVYYDTQFLSTEYPDYVGSYYNDEFTVTVDSPSKGMSTYVVDVNSGHFVLDAHSLSGTGFDLFATDGNPDGHDEVDQVDTTPRTGASDAGATALHTEGGHPVSPGEQITITFEIKDEWDNQFDSTAFIDNLMFAQYARPVIEASKTVEEIEHETDQCHTYLKYTLTISNTGVITQSDNPGDEIQDSIPENTIYVPHSATSTSGYVSFDETNKKIKWNGDIPGDSSVAITFKVQIEDTNSTENLLVSNQGGVYWDKNNDGKNEEYLSTNWANITVQPANLPPIVTEIPGQTICGDKNFSQIVLDEYVNDPDNSDEEINWEIHTARTLWRNKITGKIKASDYLDWLKISDRIATISFPEDESEWGKPEPVENYEPVIEGASFVFKPQFNAIDPCGLSAYTSSVGNFTFYESAGPMAKDDTDSCAEDGSVWTNVLDNDFVIDGILNRSSLQVITNPTHGTTSVNKSTGAIKYQPNENWYGTDTYGYQIADNDGNTDTAIVTITVNKINEPPSAIFSFEPSAPTTDDLIYFNSTSTDDESIVNWTWIMDDGNTLYDEQVTHQYSDIGIYNVKLIVKDEEEASDYAIMKVVVYPVLTAEYKENFSDDVDSERAFEYYQGEKWFETSFDSTGCNFEVSDASQFEHSNPNSFKTKMRHDGGRLLWNYNVSASIVSWEVWFYCGKSLEETDIQLDFKDNDETIAKIMIKYKNSGSNSEVFEPSIYCWDKSADELKQIGCDLSNGFYRLQIISEDENTQYYLYSDEEQEVNNMISIDQPFSGLEKIEWSSSKNAVVCPMFFWDDHIIELS